MLKHDPNYRRLPVTGRSLLGKSTYWLAPDHLLVVEVQAVVESYRRFELKDVQALELVPTIASKFVNWFLVIAAAVVAVGIGAALFTFGSSLSPLKNVLPVTVLLFAISMCLAWSLWAGPSCRFILKTAVQSVVLPGVGQRRKAERLWAEIQPAIARVQAGQGIAPLPPVSDLAAQPASPESPAAT